MKRESSPDASSQSLSILAEIDAACDRFEAEWRAGSRPQIKAYLAKASQPARRGLLPELLRVEIAYRRKKGEVPQAGDYQTFASLLDSALLASLLTPPTKAKPASSAPPSVLNASTGPFEGGPASEKSTVPGTGKAASPSPARKRFGDYELIKELGKGGMGVVYLARQLSADRLVALKLIRKDRLEHLTARQRQEWLDRFRTEGRTTARITDERVVTVYEVGALGGRPFYSMRFVKGRSLAAILEAGTLPNRPAAVLMEQVARAVQAIHDCGVLHRDLKPHNILVDEAGRPYVTDFGLAKWLDAADGVTHTGQVLGSPPYMSPEQAQDAAHVSEATDVYGLGATLYAVLTGRPPFEGQTAAEVLYRVKYREPAAPRRLNSAVSRDLETIVLKCLEKEPGRRYGSAGEMADELRRYREQRPLRTRPVGPAGRLWRWCRRNPALAALSAAAMLLITLAGSLYLAYVVVSGIAGEKGQQLSEAQERRRALAYLEDMPLAQLHLNRGELTKARELLARWRTPEGKTDLRGWEWFYLDAQCRELEFATRAHPGRVYAVAWSPNGKQLASADQEGSVRVWNLVDGTEVLQFTAGSVLALAWSPDGLYLGTAGRGKVLVWDANSGKQVKSWTVPDNSAFAFNHVLMQTWGQSLAWSPNSNRLALVDGEGKVRVWDLKADKEDPLLGNHEHGVYSAAWNKQGDRLATVGGDGLVKVWDVDIRKSQSFPLPVGVQPGFMRDNGCALTWPDNGHLAVVLGDGDMLRLDTSTGATAEAGRLECQDAEVRVGLMRTPTRRYVWSLGAKLLAAVEGADVKIWDATSGKELLRLPSAWMVAANPDFRVPGEPGGCAPAWDASGQRLALGRDDGIVTVRHITSGRRAMRAPIPLYLSRGLAWSRKREQILCAADIWEDDLKDREKKMRDWMKRKQEGKFDMPPPPLGAAFPQPATPVGQAPKVAQGAGLLQLNPRPQIQIRDAITGNALGNWVVKATPSLLAESPDSRWLASATEDGLLQLSRMDNPAQAAILEKPKPRPPAPVGGNAQPNNKFVYKLGGLLAWSPDGKRLAYSTAQDTSIRIWDPTNPDKPISIFPGDKQPLRSLSWSADNTRLASAADDGTGKIWDVASGKPITTFSFAVKQEPVGIIRSNGTWVSNMLAWSRDGKWLAVAGEDEAVHIWDVDVATDVKTLLGNPAKEAPAFHQVVCTVAWSSDGKRLASVSPDGTVLIWDTATWRNLLALQPTAGPALSRNFTPSHAGTLAWSRDDKQLALFGVAAVTIWDGTREDDKPVQQKVEPANAVADNESTAVAALKKDDKPVQQKVEPANAVADNESTAVAALEKLGAKISRDEKQPGKPVIEVILVGTKQVTDADLKLLRFFTNLQRLYLYDNQVTDAGLENIQDLRSLQVLQLSYMQITDAGLKHLKELKNLFILTLWDVRVTDAGLKELKGLQRLSELHLRNTKVTDAGVKDLQNALPKCRIRR
jgi:WD40 repeat protein/predicted Ser/Thr protein kinase